MSKTRVMRAVLLGMILFSVVGGRAEGQEVKKALGLNDPNGNVMANGARLRLTKTTWDYLRLTLRDTFKKWDYKNGSGFNLLLDPGYDETTHAAGPIRTTPFTQKYGSFYEVSRPNNDRCCGDWANCNERCRTCGQWCTTGNWTDCNAGGNRIASRGGWVQCRKPGYDPNDWPLVDWRCSSGFQEYGFYIPAAGTSGVTAGPCGTTSTSADFNEFQVCTNYYQYDTGSGKVTGSWCTSAPVNIYVGSLDYNARIFIFPNMRQENIASDPVDGWDPTLGGTVYRGPYTGYGTDRANAYETDTNCATSGPGCYNGAQCCNWWCLGCGSWAPCGTTTIQEVSCPSAGGWYTWYNYTKWPPQNSAYNPASGYDQTQGTYFRSGDDTALYINIYQMQIQSWNRGSYKPPECGLDRIYKGISGGVPQYMTDDNQVTNCMRPKMYWSLTENKWKQCDAFDTWNTDGTLNPNNDDGKWIYPGHPDTGGWGSPGRCGRQHCTWGSCTNHPTYGDWAWAPGSYTSDVLDMFSDNDGINPGRGTGWYGLKLVGNPVLNPGSNRIDVQFTGKDLRIEMGAALDWKTVWPWDSPQPTQLVTGRILLQSLVVNASIYLYSIDDASCTAGTPLPSSCSGNWRAVNDSNLMSPSGVINPDKLVIEAQITNVQINPVDPWYQGPSTCMVDVWLIGCVLTVADVLNFSFVRDMIVPQLGTAIQDALGGALSGITSAVPNLNGILGNPIALGTALIDTGIFLAGDISRSQTLPDGVTKKWPVYVTAGPSADRNLVDMRMAIGFKPIAFRPPGANGVMDIDYNDPPLADSVYGIPELWDAATTGSGGACPTSGDTCVSGASVPTAGCSIPAHVARKDADQVHDADDYCRGRQNTTTDAFYYDPKTNTKTSLAYPQTVPEFFKGPLSKYSKPPDWCLVVGANGMPRTLRTGSTPADLNNLYPSGTWLSFDSTLDKNPATGLGTRNTIGTWDNMPGYSVLQQGTYTFNGNAGVLDPNPIPYDLSMHIHQRVLNEFAQAVFASGIGCLEFAAQDTLGADTPWKDLLATERFAGFMPEIATLFPDTYVKIRIMPLKMPRIRVGMGNLNFTPLSRIQDPVNGALPITNQPYTISAALPDLQVQILATDKATKTDLPLITFKWNTVVGLYAKAVRQCYYLEGLANQVDEFGQPVYTGDSCRSPYTNKRRVSGYYELFFDLNGEKLNRDAQGHLTASGADKLGDAWESPGDARDGFADGRFTNKDWACPECSPSIPSGSTMFEVTQNFCADHPTRCRKMSLSAAIPALMSSTMQMFIVTRLNFYNLTIDFLYVGPDGPNDDGLGTAGAAPFNFTNGDYLGIYARFLGDLNVFGLLDTAALLAPPPAGKHFKAQVQLPAMNADSWVNTADPEFDVKLHPLGELNGHKSVASYTYAVDNGFWHTPVDYEKLQLSGLTEGQHTIMLRTFEDSLQVAAANLTPTVLKFSIDTLPPEFHILPSEKGTYGKAVRVTMHDLQTPADRLNAEYSWDDSNDWEELSGDSVSIRGLGKGKHTLRLRATDYAGNTGAAAREIVVSESGWGCASGAGGDSSLAIVLLALWLVAARRRRAGV